MKEVRTIREQTKLQVEEIKEQLTTWQALGSSRVKANMNKIMQDPKLQRLAPVTGKRRFGTIPTAIKRTKRREG